MLASSARAARLRPAILDAFSCKHLHLVTWNRTRTRAKTVTVSISSYAPSKFSPASQQGSNPRAQRFPSLTLENGSSSSKNHNGLSSERRSSCVRFSSSVPAMDEYEWNDSGGKGKITTDVSRDSVLAAQQLQDGRYIPVKAYFLSTSVDLKSLQVEQFFDVVPPASRSANYVILKYSNKLIHHSSINASSHFSPHVDGKDIEENKDSWSNFHYMVVFQYGSVVLFNISEQEEGRYLEIVKKYALGLLSETRKDDYAVVEKPSLETWMQGGPDYVVLKKFDIDGIRIIGSVLGQSIALDHFVRQVDGMLVEFIDLNRGMEKTGTFTMKQKKLFQLVGKANSNLADVILKLGLFERSDIAWKNAKYAEIWEYLRDEYELTQRFGSLDFKLKFVEHNVRFFLEIQHNRKTEFLEWLIIYLISAELVIAIFGILR